VGTRKGWKRVRPPKGVEGHRETLGIKNEVRWVDSTKTERASGESQMGGGKKNGPVQPQKQGKGQRRIEWGEGGGSEVTGGARGMGERVGEKEGWLWGQNPEKRRGFPRAQLAMKRGGERRGGKERMKEG